MSEPTRDQLYMITFSREAARTLYACSRPHEAYIEEGGILIGQSNASIARVTDVISSGIGDSRRHFGFVRSPRRANRIIRSYFRRSNGTKIYLGEWHTHPESTPSPSSQDQRMIVEQFSQNSLNESFILLAIAGYKAIYVGSYDGSAIKGRTHPFEQLISPTGVLGHDVNVRGNALRTLMEEVRLSALLP